MPDARVQAAVANWGSRLIANGVDYNDFVRTTGRIETWEQWLDAWCATAEEHRDLALDAKRHRHLRSAAEALLDASLCFHFAKFVWTLDLDRHRTATEASVQALQEALAVLEPSAERVEARLGAGTVVGNLRLPAMARPAPLVVLIPGLDSSKEEFHAWESTFLVRGMATLSLDGPGQGETGLVMPIRHDYEVAVAAILDAVAAHPRLDPDRVGAVGVSLGGHYVVRAAAFEPRLKAIAGVSGPYDAAAVWDTLPSLTRAGFIHHTGAADETAGRRLTGRLNLAGVAERVTQPCLIVAGRLDRVIPWEETKRIADQVPRSQWVLYDLGTHVCNNLPDRYRPLVADWIGDQLS